MPKPEWPQTFTHLLVGDASDAFEQLKAENSPALRRSTVRAVFAAIEGLLWQLKSGLDAPPAGESIGELAVLREETYSVDERGVLRTRPYYLPLPQTIRFLTRLVQRARPAYNLDFNHPGWTYLLASLEVRHRLTHPKTLEDLNVSEEELGQLSAAFAWFLAFVIEASYEHVQFMREVTDRYPKTPVDRLLASVSKGDGGDAA